MKFDRSNKFDFCYYGQVNIFGGTIYFAGDGTLEERCRWVNWEESSWKFIAVMVF